jgi:uncharacterized membrane protein YhhN
MTAGLVCWIAAAVAVSLWGEGKGRPGLRAAGKLGASAGFVVLGALRWSPGDSVGAWIVAGLVLCAVGDGLLLWSRGLDAGLVVFLAGHVAYIGAFAGAVPVSGWNPWVLVGVTACSLAAGWWLWPRLGRRRYVVAVYITVITVMVWGAVSGASRHCLPAGAAVGAVAFYLSDLAVARNRFVAKAFANRLVGLPLYYAGQVLLALAVGHAWAA